MPPRLVCYSNGEFTYRTGQSTIQGTPRGKEEVRFMSTTFRLETFSLF